MSATPSAASGWGALAAGGAPRSADGLRGATGGVRASLGGVVVVGYGNPLRGDDGIGWHAAAVLARDPRLAGSTVLQRRQLTPELAADLAGRDLAVFVDARVREETGAAGPLGEEDVRGVRVTWLRDEPPPPGAGPGSWTHHVDARALLALTRHAYGTAPSSVLVTAPARTFELTPTDVADLLAEPAGATTSPRVATTSPRVPAALADAVTTVVEAVVDTVAAAVASPARAAPAGGGRLAQS